VPEGWETIRFKFVLWLQRGHDLPVTEIIEGEYPVCGSNGCIGYHNLFTTKGPGVTVGRSGSVGEVNYIEKDYWAHNTTLYVKEFRKTIPRYAFYLLKTLDVKYLSEGTAVGTLNRNYIHDLSIIVPVITEQRTIAAFLDRKTSKIDSLTAKKGRFIDLLEEKRTALISHAVTKGLDPDAPMKDSGIEWLGEVPEGWEVKRLRFVTRISPSKSELSSYPKDTEVSFLPMELIGDDGTLSLEESKTIGEVLNGYTYFRDGDIIVAKITPCFENGKGVLSKGLINGIGFGTTELHVLRPYENYSPKFIFYLTRSHHFLDIGTAMMEGAAGQKRVPEDFIKDFCPGLPPLPEQRTIAAFLDRETTKIDKLVEKIKEQIEKLKEYRTALISAAVTGKIDVRGEE